MSCSQVQLQTWNAAVAPFNKTGLRDANDSLALEGWLTTEGHMKANEARGLAYYATGKSTGDSDELAALDGFSVTTSAALVDLRHSCSFAANAIQSWHDGKAAQLAAIASQQAQQDTAAALDAGAEVVVVVAEEAADIASTGARSIAENAGTLVIVGLLVAGLLLWQKAT